jgi:hypothetical protein
VIDTSNSTPNGEYRSPLSSNQTPCTRNSGNLTANDSFRCENEPVSDLNLHLGNYHA